MSLIAKHCVRAFLLANALAYCLPQNARALSSKYVILPTWAFLLRLQLVP